MWELAKVVAPTDMPRLESSFCKGAVFVFLARDERCKKLLLEKAVQVEYRGTSLKMGLVELI